MKSKKAKLPRGRPSHKPTQQSRRMVEVLAGFGISEAKISFVLNITPPTLRLHYAAQLERGPPVIEANLIGNLVRLSRGNTGTALKATLFALQSRFGWTVYAPAPAARRPAEDPTEVPIADAPLKPLGKKEQAEIDAQTAHESSEWADLIEPQGPVN